MHVDKFLPIGRQVTHHHLTKIPNTGLTATPTSNGRKQEGKFK